MEEQTNKVVETIEDSMLGIDFTIDDGYLSNIAIRHKSKEDIGRLDLSDKAALVRWLTQIRSGLLQQFSNQPSEVSNIMLSPDVEERVKDLKCSACQGELVKKKACCGQPGDVFRCTKCGRNYKPMKDRPRRIPPPSPLTHPEEG